MQTITKPDIKTILLSRNGYFPNSQWPVLIYLNALDLPDQKNKAATIAQQLFIRNDWKNSWVNGIYDFHHYHSNTHECLGVVAGSATVILGGPGGRSIKIRKGDLLILPAGVGHCCKTKSEDFLVVGAYPHGKEYDINVGTKEEFQINQKAVTQIPVPEYDPLFGKEGFINGFWK